MALLPQGHLLSPVARTPSRAGWCNRARSACGEMPERGDFSRARNMKRVGFVTGSWMSRLYIVSANDAQSRSFELFEQPRAGSQTEVFRQVGKDQPALAARLQMVWQRPQEAAQHPAFGIVDSIFQGRARPRGNPWRVAD